MAEKGLFIVFEGIDGCGKTTQVSKLVDWIFSTYKKVDSIVLTREPSQSTFTKEIHERLSLKNSNPAAASKERLLELFVLDREEHVDKIITPSLNKNAVVICDRYKYSTIAYQAAQGIPMAHAIDENDSFPIPDMVLIFNATPETCVERMNKSGKEMDAFEKTAFLEKVRANYIKLPALLPKETFHVINANQSIDQIHLDVIKVIRPLVERLVK
ncbi:MAG: dTMP kinase [Candidatus Diapherotrites archaeon]|uniref:Probable thymidylate kinase n=1 Tax=Candidatus Iainarchaeum sp. TaxID=3101447 RepID=A0A8T4C643_9ARCH|nr:dTMP kinase [Candidatus Diapherotrites archaeon]